MVATETTEMEAEEEETRDWAELPRDALLAVLHRLPQADVLTGAGRACHPWRRAARDEPELWRRIDLRCRSTTSAAAAGRDPELEAHLELEALAYSAVRRSAGQCEAFCLSGERFVVDLLIEFLSRRAAGLKSLRLINCNFSTPQYVIGAITALPMLEELELSRCYSGGAASATAGLAEVCSAAARACPLLARLRLNKYSFHWSGARGRDDEAMEIAEMRGLRHLQLFGNSLGNAGLAAILGGCARLESLDIRHCFNVEVNDETRAMCARLHTLRLPDDSMDDYDQPFGKPEMDPGPIPGLFPDNVEMNFGFRGDILWDSW